MGWERGSEFVGRFGGKSLFEVNGSTFRRDPFQDDAVGGR